MHDLVQANQQTIDDYKKFEDVIKITSSDVLKNQLSKTRLLLANNLEDIRLYFEYLSRIAKNTNQFAEHYN